MPTEIKQGKQGKDKKKSRRVEFEDVGSNRGRSIAGRIAREIRVEKAVKRETKAQQKTGKSAPGSTPGVKARARNLARTGRRIPVVTKGKLDKKKRGF